MKTTTSLLLLVILILLTTFASAADKYVSTGFGFAASFPANVVRTQTASDMASFVASAPGGAWVAQVKVTKNVVMPRKVTKEFMEAKLAEVLKSGFMTQTGASSYTAFHGYPALLATATFIINNRDTNFVSYSAVIDMKLIFVKSENLVNGQNRVYWVSGWAIQGQDRSGIQSFLDSFDLR
ncbi:MAG TPA: hypothetical protein VIX14_15905 [Terriglobales bacterium]